MTHVYLFIILYSSHTCSVSNLMYFPSLYEFVYRIENEMVSEDSPSSDKGKREELVGCTDR